MSTPQPAPKRSVLRTGKQKTPAERAALIAAVAGGMPQAEAAQHFNVHRNTVSRWCLAVRKVDNPANPMSKEWKETVKTHAIKAVENGLKCNEDPYKAANIGVRVLEGIGEFVATKDVHVNMTGVIAAIPEELLVDMVMTPAIDVEYTPSLPDNDSL